MAGVDQLLSTIESRALNLIPELKRLRRDFHQYPELSNHEVRTGRVVGDYLRDLGLEVTNGIAGHGVVGTLTGAAPGKVIAYRADMDALPISETVDCPWRSQVPGVMHACGHDFHLSIALVTARVLTELKDQLQGQIRFIFQPAEEGLPLGEQGGAQIMVEAGVLENPPVDAILALHLSPLIELGVIGYCPEVVTAGADRLRLEIIGQPVHAGTPHKGVDAILVAAMALIQLQSLLVHGKDAREPAVLVFTTIAGGQRFNILADRVQLEGTLRFHDQAVRDNLLTRIHALISGLTKGYGAQYCLISQPIYPILKNEPELTAKALTVLKHILGPTRLYRMRPVMGSEDFSYFAQRVPAFYFFLGARTPGTKGRPLHTPDLNPDEGALAIGLRAAASLLCCLSQSEFPLRKDSGG
ncbi:MAG: amidohydrolase [Deltaproteobacteria bacterium]|nr:amidohydrolase [Deltaproteobacteria bacterium]